MRHGKSNAYTNTTVQLSSVFNAHRQQCMTEMAWMCCVEYEFYFLSFFSTEFSAFFFFFVALLFFIILSYLLPYSLCHCLKWLFVCLKLRNVCVYVPSYERNVVFVILFLASHCFDVFAADLLSVAGWTMESGSSVSVWLLFSSLCPIKLTAFHFSPDQMQRRSKVLFSAP